MDKDALERGALQLGLNLTWKQVDQFCAYEAALEEGKARANLTSIQGEDIVPLHFLDSLTGLTTLTMNQGETLLDLGSGAGFPGVPLKIVRPDIKLHIIDASRKRLDFLEGLIQRLGLEDIILMHGRGENFAHRRGFRGRYFRVVARAVASLPVLLELCLPFCRPGGLFCAYKGPEAGRELEESKTALHILGGSYVSHHHIVLPGKEAKRTLVVIRKDPGEIPERYPRRPGIPAKRPLI